MFAKVFELVKARGYTLFVGVDDYDAPIRERSFVHLVFPTIHDRFASPDHLERVLDTHFWRPLLAGADVIHKLFVTGTLLVKYPALEDLHTLGTRDVPSLQVSCGFTEQEALNFGGSVLHKTLDIAELNRSFGGYVFPSHGVIADPVLHPQQILARFSEVSQRTEDDEDSFRLLSNILNLLPEASDVSGAVTLTALIDFLAAGAVEIDEAEAALAFDATAVTWNVLYHAGALTYDRQSAGTLRVANNAVLSLIHARVDTLFADWHDLQHTYLNTWSDYSMEDRPESFLELLSQILCDLGRASFGRKHEPNMRGVLELAMRNAHTSPGQAMDPILLLPDNATRTEVPAYRRDKTHVWEINTLTLLGMW
ncbi:hypothetical protein B0H17DRAFT_502454 [Mycena rosella]|uniref:AAA-ATPase-like domain-containing protein n=1 Tax=Mycena rosella TaxID=1033263 RepID=A0AAD7GKM4_MYCRO|nr:hypothetical protein B0H17DRAFT_502454 [Mycena rosella]